MSINWLSPTKSAGKGISDDPFRITFTSKPKGFRANATLSRELKKLDKRFFLFGFHEEKNVIYIKPVAEGEGPYRFTGNSVVGSAYLWLWANEHGLGKARLDGIWDEEQQCFAFPLV